MELKKQQFCDHCRKVNNLVLRGPEALEEVLGPAQVPSYLRIPEFRKSGEVDDNRAINSSIACYFGPSLGALLEEKQSCVLCQAVATLLKCHQDGRRAIEGSLERRVALRFVTKSGYTSDAKSPWTHGDEKLAETQSARNFRVERQYGIAGLGVDIETAPGSGLIAEVSNIGLQIYRVDNLLGTGAAVEADRNILEQLYRACPRTEVQAFISDKTIDIVKKWLCECLETHSNSKTIRCDQTVSGHQLDDTAEGPHLPTRLIAVNPKETPRLVAMKNISGRYLALSYRWGTVSMETWTLRRSNLEQSFQQLPYNLLPLTIRDAIDLTRHLGFEYLWVDSCCIIQDDEEDWMREAAMMESCYQNAMMTLAILGDRDSQTGFMERKQPQPPVEIPWLNEEGSRIASVFASNTLPFQKPSGRVECMTGLEQELRWSPWSTRAWTFQEQMLSRRILYIGEHQVYFECRKEKRSEDGFDQIIKTSSPKQSFQDALDSDFSSALSSFLRQPERWNIPPWMGKVLTATHDPVMQLQKSYLKLDVAQSSVNIDSLVHDYTSRNLTYQSDKLVAFEGLANAIAKRSGQQFNAGLWTNKMAKSLFWWLADGPESQETGLRAPTWSWMSRNGRIKGYDTEMVANDDMLVERKHIDRGAFDGLLKEVEILDGNILVTDQRGAKAMALRMKARCLKTPCTLEPASNFARSWKQLKEDVRLWSSANTSWDPQHCHILFAPTEPATGMRGWLQKKAQGKGRRCPQCQHHFEDVDEHQALSHMERCSNGDPVPEIPHNDQPKALVGVAYFDEPQKVPSSFETILLWRARSINTVYRDSDFWPSLYSKGAEGLKQSKQYHDRYGWTALKRSEQEILGFEGRRVNISMDDVGSGPAFISKTNPRIYFCLLVEPTSVEGSYRRCGVALTYWIDGAKGSGGLPLHLNCIEKALTLV